MMTVAQAQRRLSECPKNKQPDAETVPLVMGLGRVASEDVFASISIPPFDNSAMDGFALKAKELQAGRTHFDISQRIPAGSSPRPLLAGTAARIFTGGMMPLGADTVVIQEDCEYTSRRVTVLQAVDFGGNVRPKGQDIHQGARVIAQGQTLNPIDISLLASIGCKEINVFKSITVALFSTGDELVEAGAALRPGQIYNSNRPLLIALCHQLGYRVFDCGVIDDTLSATKDALANAAQNADVIISTGGVSVGEEDYVRPALEELGELALWKVRMKPGKPVAFGNIGGVPFLGLPGNPVSSFIVFQLLGVPLLRGLQGQAKAEPLVYSVVADFDKPASQREEYIRVKLSRDPQGQLIADHFVNLSSGVMSSLSWADGLVRQSIGVAISKGQLLDFLPLNGGVL